jgi:hypothetical protein
VIRTVNLVTVRGRPHSPAVGSFVREAKCYQQMASPAHFARASAPPARAQLALPHVPNVAWNFDFVSARRAMKEIPDYA